MTNLHESIGPSRYRISDPWICSQTCIRCQQRYRLRYAEVVVIRYIFLNFEHFSYSGLHKMLVFRARIHKILLRITKREDLDQPASSDSEAV